MVSMATAMAESSSPGPASRSEADLISLARIGP
jgi:hypothetical protein